MSLIVEFCGGQDLKTEDESEIVFTSYVRNEGRVTVPKELRDAYGIKVGDLVECKIRKIR